MGKTEIDFIKGELHTHGAEIHLFRPAFHTCIANANDEALANADQIALEIARRWNCFEDMLETLEAAMLMIRHDSHCDIRKCICGKREIKAAIAKAKKGK